MWKSFDNIESIEWGMQSQFIHMTHLSFYVDFTPFVVSFKFKLYIRFCNSRPHFKPSRVLFCSIHFYWGNENALHLELKWMFPHTQNAMLNIWLNHHSSTCQLWHMIHHITITLNRTTKIYNGNIRE